LVPRTATTTDTGKEGDRNAAAADIAAAKAINPNVPRKFARYDIK
jgi:hypothetical protein